MTKFVNETQPKQETPYVRNGGYRFTTPSKYLFQWSRLLQSTISQAATYCNCS